MKQDKVDMRPVFTAIDNRLACLERGVGNVWERTDDIEKRLCDVATTIDNRHIARGERITDIESAEKSLRKRVEDIEEAQNRIIDHVARFTEGNDVPKKQWWSDLKPETDVSANSGPGDAKEFTDWDEAKRWWQQELHYRTPWGFFPV